MKIVFSILALVLLTTSCSQSTESAKKASRQVIETNTSPQTPPLEIREKNEGQYISVLTPLNEHVSGLITGAATISRDEDELVGDVRFSGEAPTAAVLHEQNIHMGDRCPDASDDLNEDGIIDAVEGALVYDKILIPLDGDLNSQRMGGGIFPLADEFGDYIYSQVGSYQKFIDDLKELDLNLEDHIVKLSEEAEEIKFEGKIVVIQGVSKSAALPDTVVSNNQFTNHDTLPVACGILTRVTTLPGNSDPGNTDRPLPPVQDNSAEIDDGAVIPVPPRTPPTPADPETPETSPESDEGGAETSDPGNYGEDDTSDIGSEGYQG
jgi:hypothetical protein